MTIASILTVVGFWAMQVFSQLFFKWGSMADSHWLWGFVGGNLSGLCSVFLLMFAYKSMNASIAFGICTGGAFIAVQLALVLLFRSELSLLQWIGVGMTAVGMIMFAAAKQGAF